MLRKFSCLNKDFKSLPGWLDAIIVSSENTEKYSINYGRLKQLEIETTWEVLKIWQVIVLSQRVTAEIDSRGMSELF